MRETFTSWRSQSSFRQNWLTRPIYAGLFYCYCDIWHCGPYCTVPHTVPCLHCATFQGHTVVQKRLKLRGPWFFLQDAIYFIGMVVILKVLFLKKLRLGGKLEKEAFVAYKHLKKRFNSRSLRPAFFLPNVVRLCYEKTCSFWNFKLQYSRLVPVAKTSKRASCSCKTWREPKLWTCHSQVPL